MKMVLAGVLAVAIAGAAMAQSAAGHPAVQSALAWLSLVDAAKYDQSWSQAGALFQHGVAQDQWPATVARVRDPLGPVLSRTLRGAQEAHQLPGAPDGDYRIVQFDTSFTHKASAVETVVLADEAGAWKVNGYFIK
jgi:hypothetical protein